MLTRRELTADLLRAATAFGLLAALREREVLAAPLQSEIDAWFAELAGLTADLRGRRIADLEFQARVEQLLARVDLAELAATIDLDALARRIELPERGAAGLDLGLTALLPARLGLRTRLFACRKGRSIVPHGHVNMCTGLVVLRGTWRGRHYDRVESHPGRHVLAPTIDRSFAPGDVSTVSDHKDNVHWFEATSDVAFLFNAHVAGHDPRIKGSPGRLYLDPAGPRRADGLIDAPAMTRAACLDKYG